MIGMSDPATWLITVQHGWHGVLHCMMPALLLAPGLFVVVGGWDSVLAVGCRSQHNLGYWENAPFYAFGLGAASYLYQRRFSRPRTMAGYQQWVTNFARSVSPSGNIPGFDTMQPEPLQEQLLDYVMLRLRLADGIPMHELERKFGHDAVQAVVGSLIIESPHSDKYALEMMLQGRRHIRLTDPEGFLMSNDCIATVFAELSREGNRYPHDMQT